MALREGNRVEVTSPASLIDGAARSGREVTLADVEDDDHDATPENAVTSGRPG